MSETVHDAPGANGETIHDTPGANGETIHDAPGANGETVHDAPGANGETIHDAAPDDLSRGGRRVAPYLAALAAVLLAGLVTIMVINRGGPTDSARSPLIGNPAPAASGVYADGTTFDLSRRKGSWVVLNFFRHDCAPCIAEHPELIEFVDQQRALGRDGAEFYTIVQQSTREEVEEFFAERGGGWPIVYDDDYEFQIGFGVMQQPETWIVSPSGIVMFRTITTVTADQLSLTIQDMREAGVA